MDNRATETEVLAILDTTLEAEDITPFLDFANMVVTRKLVGVGYSDSNLRLIETWLAAHLVCTKDPQIAKERTGRDTDTTYDGKTGMGLDLTRYGQQVKVLEDLKILAGLDSSKGTAELKTLA